MTASPNFPDDSPLARLRQAAARLHGESGAGGAGGANGAGATFAPRPEPQPEPAPAPAPAWQPPPPPAYAPPAYAPPRPAAAGPERRTPLLVGGIVAAVLVVVLVAVGLVAMSGDDDEAGSGDGARSAPTTQVTAATTLAPPATSIPENALYAPVAGYTFAPLPEGSLELARSPFKTLPDLRGTLDHISGRTLLRNGANTAVVLVYEFNQRFLDMPGGSDEFLDGVTLVSSEVQPVRVAGQEGVYFVYGSSHAGVAVLKGDVALLVQGPFSTPKSRLEQITASFLGRV